MLVQPEFYLTHLYPKEMNIYGDIGNIIALKYRLQEYGFKVIYQPVGLGDKLPARTDFYFMGGGQDVEQVMVAKDLKTKKSQLKDDVDAQVPGLLICGGYQLFGQEFYTGGGETISGLGILNVHTIAPNAEVKSRCVGNLIVSSLIPELPGVKFIGFENHSGQTFILNEQTTKPLGKVLKGHGNSYDGQFEGAVYKNLIGTYMHGSCLPKNPELADYLLFKSFRLQAEQKILDPEFYLDLREHNLDDSLASSTKQNLFTRFLSTK